VTRVEVGGDLRRATIYYTVLGQDRDHRRTQAGLRSATPRLRAILGHQVRLKFTPELEFREDVGLSAVERVNELLKQLRTKEEPE
jgi:ribosome-binding factor A